ncbi:MAG: MFS transporter, partial [Candidatus Hodarchaeota archaeon]
GILFLTTFKDTRKIDESKFDINKLFLLIKEALSKNSVRLLGICAFLMFFSYIAALTFTSVYLGDELSMKAAKIGIVISSAGFAAVIVAIPAGYLVDIIGRQKVILIGFTIMFIAFMLLPFANTFKRFIILFFLLGCGTGTVWPALNTIAVELIPEKRATVASLYNSFRFWGYAASPILLAPIYLELSIKYLYLTCAFIVIVNILIASLLCKKFVKS